MFTKNVSKQFLRRVKIHWGHVKAFYEKRGQVRVYCECWLSYLFLLCLGDSVLSEVFPERSGKQPLSFRKLKYLTKIVVVMKRKMKQCVFLAGLDWNYPYSTGGKFCFWHYMTIHKFTKTCFPARSEWCEITRRTHCTIPWEVRSEKSILWCWLPFLLLIWSAELSYQMTAQQTVSSSLLLSESSNNWLKLLL